MKKTFILLFLVFMLINMPNCSALGQDTNAMAAVALYVDTSGHYIPGADMLNKALNEVIRFKVNALFLGSEVVCGNEVLRDLCRYNINTSADINTEALADFSGARHVNYVIIISVYPFDVSMNLKAYSSATNSFLVDKAVTRPEGMESISNFEVLSNMVGNEITQVLEFIRG